MQIKGKIKHRYDTLSNWTRDNVVLLRGELAIIDCGDQTRFKVGNGISAFTQLPFIDEHALSALQVAAYDIGQSTQANSTPFGLASGQRLSTNETLKTVKTRISLKTDTLSNWSTSTLQLYNGEVALGYDSTTGKYEVRIGTAGGKTWSELSSSNIVLSSKNILNLEYDSYELSNVTPNSSKDFKFQLVGRDPATQEKIAIGSPIAISSAVYVENGSDTFNQLSVIKISKSDFDAKVGSGSPVQGNVLYVVDSNIIDAYGQQMKNLGDPTDLSDAATKGYVDKTKEDLSTDYTSLIDRLSGTIDKKIYIEDKISSEISGYSDLSVIKLSSNDYQDLVDSDATLSNALYIVESDFIDAYGQQIKNLSAPDLSDDAATKGYVDGSLTAASHVLSTDYNEKINAIDPLNVSIQMIKPISDERMHLSIDLFTDKEMTNSILPSPIDTETSSRFFYSFLPNGNDSHWTSCDVSGFSRESNGLPVLFDMPEVFKELSIDFYSIDALYARYSWYYLSAGSRIFSDPYTTTLPATTEVGANAQDVVPKSEFYKLYQNVVPQSQGVVVDDGNYFLTYSTKYNIVTSRVENGEKIALMEYDKHKTYKIDLSTSTSENVELVFYTGLANGNIEWSAELNAEQHVFEKGKHYFIEVRDQKIFVYDGDAVYASQGGSSGGIYRYPLVTAELSAINGSLCCLIQDHAITTIEVSSAATPLVIKLPPKPDDNGARDFILRIEVSSSTAPGVTFSGLDESITFDSDSEDWMAIEPGLNLISFTETK